MTALDGFERAFNWVLGAEGRYSNDPNDPGGATKWGISHRSYPTLNIGALTVDDARALYLRDYWQPCRCDEMPPAFALAMFDAAVHSGQARASRWLQRALGVQEDGKVGPETLSALRRATLDAELTSLFSFRAIDMASQPAAHSFLHGWFRRLFRLHRACLGIGL